MGPVGEDGAQALEQGRFIAQKETGRHFLRIEQETIVLRVPAISLAIVAGAKAGGVEQIDQFGRRDGRGAARRILASSKLQKRPSSYSMATGAGT